MWGCFGGWSLDAFDVQMYSFVIPTVISLWGLSRGEAGLIGTVTLLISSLGGWFSGTLADRFGRVRMLQITILRHEAKSAHYLLYKSTSCEISSKESGIYP